MCECKKHCVSHLATHPSFHMVFDRAVNGGNCLFSESVSEFNFIGVVQLLFMFSLRALAGNISLLTAQSCAFMSRA